MTEFNSVFKQFHANLKYTSTPEKKICTYKSQNISDSIKPNSNKMIVVYLFLGLLALALANAGNEGFFSNLKD